MQQHPREHDSCSPGNMISRTSSHAFAADFWSERYIRQIKYVFCAAFVDFVSCDDCCFVIKKVYKSFPFAFVYFNEF